MSIIHHGYKQVDTCKIRAPGDIEAIRRERHALDLGDSLASTGGKPADPIIVEYATGKLLGGKHRFAAALNEGIKQVWVIMLEGTAEELERACLVEQIRRRKATDAEIARLVELEHPTPEQTFPDVTEDEPEEEARPKGTKREAIEKVAALTGRTPAAVQQADYRAKKSSEPEYSDKPSTCLDWMGLLVDEEVERGAQVEHSFLEGIEKALVKLQGDCTRRQTETGLEGYPILRGNIHEAASACRPNKPTCVCPHCKLTKLLRKGCLACRGRGWLREAEARNIPAMLLEVGDKAGVYVDGKWTLLKEVAK